jgi:dCTP deaminase
MRICIDFPQLSHNAYGGDLNALNFCIFVILNLPVMILTDKAILDEMAKGTIKVEPYDRNALGSNSYDVHLGKYLATYTNEVLDAKQHNTIQHFEIPEEGIVLEPSKFYLGVTLE